MAFPFDIVGISDTYKRPIFAAKIIFGAGPAGAASQALRCLVAGMKTSAGSMTVNASPVQCFDTDMADAYGGPGSEVALEAQEALATGAEVWMCATAEPSGGTAGTLVSVLGGTWTQPGDIKIIAAGKTFTISASATDDVDSLGAAIVSKLNNDTRLPFTAAYNTGSNTLTLTLKNKGARGTDWIVELDTTKGPSGLTMSWIGYGANSAVTQPSGPPPVVGLTGVPLGNYTGLIKITTGGSRGTAYFDYATDGVTYTGTPIVTAATVALGATGLTATFATGTYVLNDVYSFTSTVALTTGGTRARFGYNGTGTGVDDVTTLLTALVGTRWGRIAPAQNDATQAAQWEAAVNAEGAPLLLRLEHLVFGHNGTLTQATTLSQTTLNAYRAQLVAARNLQKHPALAAASTAGMRAVREASDPVPDYDCDPSTGKSLVMGMPGQAYLADRWTEVEEETLLNAGVTPLRTVGTEVHIVRAITTYCLNGSAQDERCLDIGDAVFPDYAAIASKAFYETEWRPANKYVGPDPTDPELEAPANVGTPRIWNSALTGLMKDWYANGWIESPVGVLAPQSSYNSSARRIQSLMPLVVSRVQHQMLQTIRQQAPG